MAEDDGGTSLAWFLVGAALGAAGALLLAPQSGSETRESLRRRTLDSRERLSKSGREAYEKGRELYDRGREVAEDAAELFEKGRKVVSEKFSPVSSGSQDGEAEGQKSTG